MQATMERLNSTLPCSPFAVLAVMFGLRQDHHIVIIMLRQHTTVIQKAQQYQATTGLLTC